jgi:hypothetical protein
VQRHGVSLDVLRASAAEAAAELSSAAPSPPKAVRTAAHAVAAQHAECRGCELQKQPWQKQSCGEECNCSVAAAVGHHAQHQSREHTIRRAALMASKIISFHYFSFPQIAFPKHLSMIADISPTRREAVLEDRSSQGRMFRPAYPITRTVKS